MKKILTILFCILCTCNILAQSLRELETNPTFKGITIGMPITDIANILQYVKEVDGKTVYTINNPSYCSVFGIKMDYVKVIALNAKVYAIIAVKEVRGSSVTFNSSELKAIESGLARHYGEATHYVADGEHFGVQWISQTKRIDNIMTFFGTGIGYKLMFAISEYKEDY